MKPDESMLSVEYAGLHVSWRPELDGGGRAFGQDYLAIVPQLFRRVGTVMEFCAGPAFIGFSMLAHGLCDSLVLVDVNPEAVAAAEHTVARNKLGDRVRVYLSDGLSDVPQHERVDLVVSNPPHFAETPVGRPSIITDDPGWRVHRDFYQNIGKYLAPGGSVLIQENSEGSRPEDFRPLIDEGGLDFVRAFWFTAGRGGPTFYYVWSTNRVPGLVTYSGGQTVAVALGDNEGAASTVLVPAPGLCTLRVTNGSQDAVRIRLVDDTGTDQLWVPLQEITSGGTLDLPLLALRPGVYTFVDHANGAVRARLSVAA